MFTGTVANHVKMQMLDTKWQQKKKDINSRKKEDMTAEQRMLESFKEQAAKERERSATSELYTKLQTGGTLTVDEIAYLKENNPEALAEYERAQAEKKAYEKALKNCRTKEEVDRLKVGRLGSFAAQAKTIANNPYIPKGKKLELLKRLNNEICLIRDAHNKFVRSGAYKDLPEEAEIAEENAKEKATQKDDISAGQMESTKDAEKEKTEFSEELTEEDSIQTSGDELYIEEFEIEKSHEKTGKTKRKVTTDNLPVETKELLFEHLSQDIERYLRRNGSVGLNFTSDI